MNPKKIISLSYFVFVALLAASIPVSRFMISVFQFCLAGIFILEGVDYSRFSEFYQQRSPLKRILHFIPFHLWLLFDAIARQFIRIGKNRNFLVFLLFSLVYIAGMIYTANLGDALRVLRNNLPILLLPIFFTAITSISRKQKQAILLMFALSVSVSSLISFSIFLNGNYDDIRRISPYINHIHLAIFVCYAIFILYDFIHSGIITGRLKWPAIVVFFWLVVFQVMILKSLTGVIILTLGIYFIMLFHRFFNVRINPFLRYATIFVIPAVALTILVLSALKFYRVDDVNPDELERYTARGNWYHHDVENRMIENGHYVYLYISDIEMREEWNKVSHFDFDSLDSRGQPLKYTLIRYLTSKGLRKDAQGMQQLNSTDIRMVEAGLANYIYANKLSIYPRIYQVLWELDVYLKSGNPTGHSATQRLESLRMGLQIVKQHPLAGVGTGDLIKSYHDQYEKSGSPVPKHMRITGANQFLNFVVQFGILGFAIILFAWIYPATRKRAFSNPLFVIFIFISCIAMFSEEMLRFQTGVTFFAFFYSFYVLLPESDVDELLTSFKII